MLGVRVQLLPRATSRDAVHATREDASNVHEGVQMNVPA